MKKIQVLTDFLEAHDAIALKNTRVFDRHGILVLNLMSPPGAGKTLILEKTIEKVKENFKLASSTRFELVLPSERAEKTKRKNNKLVFDSAEQPYKPNKHNESN
jgi:Ni2+-binding GTPase involved in maturation of urease and hydrogenase